MNTSLRAGVLAAAGVRVPWADLAALRANPGSFRGQSLGPLVRQSDELTLVGVVAVLKAIESVGWHERSFDNWGVVASGRALGRIRFDAAITRFRKMQTRGASPLTIPHLSLHAAASTISIALGMHGPNFGVSAQAGHLAETLLMGLGSVRDESAEGFWVVAAEFDPQPELGENGEPTNEAVAYAAAMAVSREVGAMELGLAPGSVEPAALSDLVKWLAVPHGDAWRGEIPGAGVVELRNATIGALRKAS